MTPSTEERWYPNKITAGEFGGKYNRPTVEFLLSDDNELHAKPKDQLQIAELGIWKGATSYQFAMFLEGQGKLHLFDYEDNVATVATALKAEGFSNVVTWGSSYKYLDSYNWALMKILREHPEPVFDYVYLDGAHTWAIDALAFCLCDRLLKPLGYIAFDDYEWRLRGSSVDPSRVRETGLLYTEEQIGEKQVKLIVDLLVRRNSNYHEIVPQRIFQKMA